MVERKLYKTKLCNLYQRGHCHRQTCSFAHGDADLRGSFHGRRDYHGSDLREKLDRRHSPVRRYSAEREARGRHGYFGDSPRSLGRNGKHRKKQQNDGQSDFSGSMRLSEGTEDKGKGLRGASYESKDMHDEQLRKFHSEISLLDEHKHRLENYIDERIKEADSLNSRIQGIEVQLSKEKEESRRITSQLKKFAKAYNRQLRLEDELKRSHAQLQKMGEQLVLDSSRLVVADDPRLNTSDEESAGDHLKSQRIELPRNASLSKKRPKIHTEVDDLPLQAANPPKGEVTVAGKGRLEKLSRWTSVSNSDGSKKVDTNGNVKNVPRSVADEYNSKFVKHASYDMDLINKPRVSEAGVLFPSTSMAARASNEFVDIVEAEETIEMVGTHSGAGNEVELKISALPFPPPPPPPVPKNAYAEHKGDVENVDIDGTEEETMEVDIV